MKNNNSGFGLVEVMVAAGILGALAVVLMNLNKQSATTLVKSKVDQESLLVVNEMVSILSDPVNCMASLGGRNAESTAPGVILRLFHKGQPKFAVNTESGDAGLKVKSYSISAAAPGVSLATNTTNLSINFERKKIQNGSGDIVKNMRLHVEFDSANNITGCRSLSSASTDIWTRADAGDIYYSGGRVGVGTADPRGMLEVVGGVRASKGSTPQEDLSHVGFSFENDGDTGMFAEGGDNTQGSSLVLKQDSTTSLILKNGRYYGTPDCFEVQGPQALTGSVATCPSGSTIQSGGGYCVDGNVGYLHSSIPQGNGWAADCFGKNDIDVAAVAIARCCRLTPP